MGFKIHVTADDNKTTNAENLCEPPILELFPLQYPTGIARANPQTIEESAAYSQTGQDDSFSPHFSYYLFILDHQPRTINFGDFFYLI